MKFLYNIIFTVGFLLASPYYFMRMRRRGNWRTGFAQRFGEYDAKLRQAITNRRVIWLHAVSVGEVGICTHLVRALEERLPNAKLVVSTTTTTGMGELHKKLPSHISKIYYPIDRKKFVARALHTFHPEAIILIEAEIWPNFIWRANSLGKPLFLVNARISDRSFRRYRRFGFLFRPLFASFAGVGVQNEADGEKLRQLGCHAEAIRVVGSLKYDAAKVHERRTLDVPKILEQAGARPGAPVFVAGSTHAGEEKLLAAMVQRLKQQFPELFLVLVPRHAERCREVARELSACGMNYMLRSEVGLNNTPRKETAQCLLVNSTGELKYFYEHAALVFVGKSLTAEGGQNPLEPGALGKAMVFGPNMQNFADVTRALLERQGAIQVRDAEELERACASLLADAGRREALGRRAQEVVRENLGAIERTVDMIVAKLGDDEHYIVRKK